jgi:Kazal-type serine protease inhibitor domain
VKCRGRLALAALAVHVVSCDARELPVFELPAQGGGAAGNVGADAAGGGAGGGGAGGSPGTAGSGGGAAAPMGGMGGTAGSGYGGGGAGSGGVAGAGEGTCTSRDECPPDWECEKPSCDAAVGTCSPPASLFCEPEPAPVCGCDGVTYWNDCVRRQWGAQLASNEECSLSAFPCVTGDDCAVRPGASCARLVLGGSVCGGDAGPGKCWMLPTQCSPNFGDPRVWQECRPPEASPAPCVDACLAILSERPHARKKPGDPCR